MCQQRLPSNFGILFNLSRPAGKEGFSYPDNPYDQFDRKQATPSQATRDASGLAHVLLQVRTPGPPNTKIKITPTPDMYESCFWTDSTEPTG